MKTFKFPDFMNFDPEVLVQGLVMEPVWDFQTAPQSRGNTFNI